MHAPSTNQPMKKITESISAVLLMILFIFTTTAVLMSPLCSAAAPSPGVMGLPGCKTRCGKVSVPYPFGMGPKRCYWPGFKLTCDHNGSEPPRLLLGDGGASQFEVVGISLENVTVRVISHKTRDYGNSRPWILDDSSTIGPYILKPSSNEFILTGCNKQAMLLRNGSIVSGCVSFCTTTAEGDETYLPNSPDPNSYACSNLGCCQSSIVMGSAFYYFELKQLDYFGRLHGQMPVNVLIAEVGWFHPMMLLNKSYAVRASRVPVVLQWAVAYDTVLTNNGTRACPDDAARSICRSTDSKCSDESTEYSPLEGYSCHCEEGYRGNPYLASGCQDIKECDQKEKHGCFGDCDELPGSFRCRCPQGTRGNSTIPGGCVKSGNLGLIIGLSIASGPCVLLLVLGALLITRGLKKRKAKALRRKFFSQNRGHLLEKLVSHRADIAERMIISLEELEKATNNFDQARKLGGGGHGTVYKGILTDLHVVAIKKSNIVVKREIDEFINEVAILSQINHKNIVKLHGCCLETEVPLLAYEFISNGTLSDHLHTETAKSLPWKDRLRITGEISKALAYLHSAISVPIIHRDIKPSNILLDGALTAKVSDFGASRYIPVDQTGTTTAVQGTIGYLDPTYYYTRRLTESSDVYSFGVLVVELLTRKRPSLCMSSEGDWLVMQFVELLAVDNLATILDPQVVEEGGSEVKELATLAASCMKLIAEERPTMRQVEMVLEGLQAPKERVLGGLTEAKDVEKYTESNFPSTSNRAATQREASRCRSQEEEFILSATHPR